jgi:CheY-like chemotaxis protein
MSTTITLPPIGIPMRSPRKKKRVLLVDTSSVSRDMRSKVMRTLGMEVDCAVDIAEARSWWKAGLYDLVLIDMAGRLDHGEKFCDDIRTATPPQQLAFLVGAPDYVATSHIPGQELTIENANGEAPVGDITGPLAVDLGSSSCKRWGILEASERIRAVRSASAARTPGVERSACAAERLRS